MRIPVSKCSATPRQAQRCTMPPMNSNDQRPGRERLDLMLAAFALAVACAVLGSSPAVALGQRGPTGGSQIPPTGIKWPLKGAGTTARPLVGATKQLHNKAEEELKAMRLRQLTGDTTRAQLLRECIGNAFGEAAKAGGEALVNDQPIDIGAALEAGLMTCVKAGHRSLSLTPLQAQYIHEQLEPAVKGAAQELTSPLESSAASVALPWLVLQSGPDRT